MVRERLTGTLARLRVAPITRAQVLAGKGLACWVAVATLMTLLIAFGAAIFHVRIASIPMLAAAIACTACCFTGLMMLLSVGGRSISTVSGMGWGANVLMAMLGGGMIPLAFMPPWMRTLSHVSPVKWGILSLEGAIWRDFSPIEMLPACGVLLAVGSISFLLGARIFARQEG